MELTKAEIVSKPNVWLTVSYYRDIKENDYSVLIY